MRTLVAGASLRLGGFALRDVDLRLDGGEVLVILGPNGAGKSVTLEMIAGFHRPERGRIVIAGRDVTDLPPERRRVGFVVQDFALFPHLSVAANVAFGRDDGAATVAELLQRFDIAHLAGREPRALSPGEKQRVALARALATRPDLFLFDEPFAALDARSRSLLRDELKGFLREARIPAIFVTHDAGDAFVLADRIAVLHRGAVLQSGPLDEVYRRPASTTVADVVGVENILPGRIAEPGHALVAGRKLRVAAASQPAPGPAALCIRAEAVRLGPAGAAGDGSGNRLPARVRAVTRLGPLARVTLDCGFPLVAYTLAGELRQAPGDPVTAEIDPAAIHLVGSSDTGSGGAAAIR